MFFKKRRTAHAQRSTEQWCVAIVGMNATGKSRFGKRLAAKLQLKRIDTDTECKKQIGEIRDFIEAKGLDAFRKYEEDVIISALQPGHLVVLSGGAVESADVRKALKKRAAVIWIRAGKAKVVRNIAMAKKTRHEFAKGTPNQIAEQLLQKRNPLYEDVADITLYEHVRYQDFIPITIAELRKFYSKV